MISLVTTVFLEELSMLKLQAISVDRFLDPLIVDDILVIGTDPDIRHRNRFDAEIRPLYGRLSKQVIYRDYDEIFPGVEFVDGWHRQQLAKLYSSNMTDGRFLYILDAKQWFTRPVVETDLFDAAVAKGWSPPLMEEFIDDQKMITSLLDLSPQQSESLQQNTLFGSPALVPRSEIIDCLSYIQSTRHAHLHEIYHLWPVLEFPLITSWIVKRYGSLSAMFSMQEDKSFSALWDPRQTLGHDLTITHSILDTRFFLCSMHRRIWAVITESMEAELIRIWLDLGFFVDPAQCLRLISDIRSEIVANGYNIR
jgi:hypothetical protein